MFKSKEGFRKVVGGGKGSRIKVWFTREENYIGKVLFIGLIVRT